jgi:streptomycin 6-kinase
VRIPAALRSEWAREGDWLAALPGLAAECAGRWGLELEEPVDTPHSLVVPAGGLVLKLNAPGHHEADHEADALAHYDGRGAVRLVARDDERRALLIERCRPGTQLGELHEPELRLIASLLPQHWRAPTQGHRFRTLVDEAARWAVEVPSRHRGPVVDEAVAWFREAAAEQRELVVANQDLHGGNVLAAEREPWLLIDPKPIVAERELDAVGVLRNAVRHMPGKRALDILAAETGLDRVRLRGWGLAHAVAWDNLWEAERIAAR